MKYYVMTRAKDVGGGWRVFGGGLMTFEAATPEEACSQCVPQDDVLWQLRHHGIDWQSARRRYGTPEKPFTYCGGDIEICAIPVVGETCEESERHYYVSHS